jgi:hypothetical protein
MSSLYQFQRFDRKRESDPPPCAMPKVWRSHGAVTRETIPRFCVNSHQDPSHQFLRSANSRVESPEGIQLVPEPRHAYHHKATGPCPEQNGIPRSKSRGIRLVEFGVVFRKALPRYGMTRILTLAGPWTPMVSVSSMSAVLLGPVSKVTFVGGVLPSWPKKSSSVSRMFASRTMAT